MPFGTGNQWVTNTRVDPEGSTLGSMNAPQVRKGYRLELWPICQAMPWTKCPNFEVLLYLDKFAFSCGGSSIGNPPFCFPMCFAVVARLNVGPKGVHRREQ